MSGGDERWAADLWESGEVSEVRSSDRREHYLLGMELVVPRSGLLVLLRLHYAKPGNGRRLVGLEMLLRPYFVQQWSDLSDPALWSRVHVLVLLRSVGLL